MAKTIRLATAADASGALKVYSEYINTPVTFEYSLPTEAEFAQRIINISSVYPYLVCLEDSVIVGYAYAHAFRERAAYVYGVELSVYISSKYTHCGVGTLLYNTLFELLKLQNVITLYSLVTMPNSASTAIHKSFGFETEGILHNTGFKAGKWYDVAIYTKNLSDYPPSPAPFIPFPDISKDKIDKIIEKAIKK